MNLLPTRHHLGAVLLSALALLAPPPAQADDVPVPGTVTAAGTAESTVRFPVATGVTPISLRMLLSVTGAETGTVAVSIDGHVVRRVPVRDNRTLTVPVSPKDVRAGGVALGVQYLAPAGTGCTATPASVAVRDLVLEYSGQPRVPTSLGTFFTPDVSSVQVVIDAKPSDDAIEAGLTAVAALSRTYAAPVPVTLVRDGQEAVSGPRALSRRVVRIDIGLQDLAAAAITQGAGVPTLTLTGHGAALSDAARALGSPSLRLASERKADSLSLTTATSDADTTLDLTELGATSGIRLSGWGVSTAYVGISQDRFDGPIESFDVHLEGLQTATQGATARVDAFLNDELVASTPLDDDPAFVLDFRAEGGQVHADNGLQLVLTALPTGGRCGAIASEIPVMLDINRDRSQVEAIRGTGSNVGFGLYPQVFAHDVPVALRSTSVIDGSDQVALAAGLLSSLQRAASELLTVRLVTVDDLMSSHDSGILVGATDADTDALEAPLRLDRMRLIDFAQETFKLGADSPFAALQSVPAGDRMLLVLGAWSPGSAAVGGTMMARIVDQTATQGWRYLREDLVVATPAGAPFDLSTGSVLPQPARIAESRSAAIWVAGGVAGVLLLLGAQLLLTARRKRQIESLVDAQASEEPFEDAAR